MVKSTTNMMRCGQTDNKCDALWSYGQWTWRIMAVIDNECDCDGLRKCHVAVQITKIATRCSHIDNISNAVWSNLQQISRVTVKMTTKGILCGKMHNKYDALRSFGQRMARIVDLWTTIITYALCCYWQRMQCFEVRWTSKVTHW